MSELSSEIIKVDGKRALKLAYSHMPRDPRRIELVMVVENEVENSDGVSLPFAYQFIRETSERRYAILRIVAGPGVSVRHDFPTEYVPVIDLLPLLYIYRVQDIRQVPPMGVDIVERQLLAPYEINAPPPSQKDELPLNYFQVIPRMNGTVIRHPASATEMRITAPPDLRAAEEASDGAERYSIGISAPEVQVGNEQPFATVVTTPGVKVDIGAIPRNLNAPARLNPLVLTDFFRVYRLKGFYQLATGPDVDVLGQKADETYRVLKFDRVPTIQETLLMAAIDLDIGFIPVVGDLVDIAEFTYGIFTGFDRWGRKLTTTDLVLMGMGALLPFVAAPVLRRGGQLLKRFGDRAKLVDEALESLDAARFAGKDAEIVANQTALITKGLAFETKEAGQVINKIAKVEPKPLALDDLLNRGKEGFAHPELQALYDGYVRKNKPALPARDWALAVTHGRPRDLLEKILTKDYVKLAGGRGSVRPKNLLDIPRPEGFTDDLVNEALGKLANDPKLFERLDNLVENLKSTDETVRALARVQISAGHFRILKGNVAEILSHPKQVARLAEIAAEQTKADAVLISGVRMRLPKKVATGVVEGPALELGPALEFSDNIIAAVRGNQLHLFNVLEVKSGYQGGAEATEQVFKWVERNLEDGAQLVLPKGPKGSKLTRADGTFITLEETLSFTYKPKPGATGGVVVGLQNARRTLITASGASHLGVDSASKIAATVDRQVIDDLTSAHLDFLVGQIVQKHYVK